ncbi:MAG: cupredoxin domain-containing protein, partial [Nitrososphaera sp.]
MSKAGKSLSPKKGAIIAAVVIGVSAAMLIGLTINSTVARNVFPSDVVHPEKSVIVTIPNNAYDPDGNATFSPKEITLVLGVNNTAIWENHSPNSERVIGAYESMPGGFGEIKGLIPPGGSWAFTFTEEGVYDYLSDIHPWLKGTVVVKEADSGIKRETRSQPTVYYGFDNNGSVIPCIVTKGDSTPMIKIYAENTMGPDAVVDFRLSAKNAEVSLEPSSDFKSSS